jgi:hypothetical protein
VELGLCANDLRVTKGGVFIDTGNEVLLLSPFFFPFAAFGLAISVLTIVFVLPMLVISIPSKCTALILLITQNYHRCPAKRRIDVRDRC